MIRTAVFNLESSAGKSRSDDKGSRFDSIGDDRVFGAAERFNAFDLYRLCTGSVNSRAHLVQQVSEIDYLGLAGCVVKCRSTAREGRGHHQVLSSGNGDFVEVNVSRAQTPVLRRACNDVAGFEFHFRAKLLKSGEVQL